MLCLFIIFFWTGLLLLTIKKKHVQSLKERALIYYGDAKQKINNSGAGELFRRKRLELGRGKCEKELLESLVFIKNLIAINQGKAIGAVALFEELAENSKLLAPAYSKMAFYMHTGNAIEAGECLFAVIGTDFAKDIGSFLAGWEEIDPSELGGMLDAYIESLRAGRLAKAKQRDEVISDLIYFPVVINCMAVLLNFVYIAFFIEQQALFYMLF